MSSDMVDVNKIFQPLVESTRASFHDFARKRATDDPGFLRRTAKTSKWQAEFSRLFAFVPVNGSKVRGKKYIFLSARHDQLVSRFHSEEAALVGGPNDRALAGRTRLPFLFTGDLLSASSSILFGTRMVPVRWVISRWLRFFSRQQDPCYLVVPNDTLPIALLLVKIAEKCGNMKVVCIQHGLFNSGFEFDDIEGRNSSINLVYCDSQRREMERRLPGALVEVMGFPSEFQAKARSTVHLPVAVLVGTGTLEDFTSYRLALDIFGRVRSALEHAGFRVQYRPHPTEDGVAAGKDAFPMNRDPKHVLLAEERKVFVGFNSTLLYEAHIAGHVVIVLNDIAQPGYSISEFGHRFDTAQLDQIGKFALVQLLLPLPPAPLLGVRFRFEQALGRAMDRRLLLDK